MSIQSVIGVCKPPEPLCSHETWLQLSADRGWVAECEKKMKRIGDPTFINRRPPSCGNSAMHVVYNTPFTAANAASAVSLVGSAGLGVAKILFRARKAAGNSAPPSTPRGRTANGQGFWHVGAQRSNREAMALALAYRKTYQRRAQDLISDPSQRRQLPTGNPIGIWEVATAVARFLVAVRLVTMERQARALLDESSRGQAVEPMRSADFSLSRSAAHKLWAGEGSGERVTTYQYRHQGPSRTPCRYAKCIRGPSGAKTLRKAGISRNGTLLLVVNSRRSTS